MPSVFNDLSTLTLRGEPYQVERVGLIGIAEHFHPVAFITPGFLPSKADLTNATFRATLRTRALTGFEVSALKQLKAGSNVVEDQEKHLIVGAIRARESCLKCHDGKTGTLLGALSYQMAPLKSSDNAEITSLVDAIRQPESARR